MIRPLLGATFLTVGACGGPMEDVALQRDASPDAVLPDAAARKEAGPHGCPTDLPGPPLVQIPVEDSQYCIDAREVTQSQYQKFVNAVLGSDLPNAPGCAWNDALVAPEDDTGEFVPGTCSSGAYDPGTLPDYAVVCVDWCDAAAYCQWAGKRLCGPLPGRDATTEVRQAYADTEWRYACTNGGTTRYPYGDEYMGGICEENAFPSAGSSSCVGLKPPFSELRDLAGGVSEWTALCEQQGSCSIEGFDSGEGACSGGVTPNGIVSASIGFRCCADVQGAR